jgi:hypothetical protein
VDEEAVWAGKDVWRAIWIAHVIKGQLRPTIESITTGAQAQRPAYGPALVCCDCGCS